MDPHPIIAPNAMMVCICQQRQTNALLAIHSVKHVQARLNASLVTMVSTYQLRTYVLLAARAVRHVLDQATVRHVRQIVVSR
jgi:hypothetical protein